MLVGYWEIRRTQNPPPTPIEGVGVLRRFGSVGSSFYLIGIGSNTGKQHLFWAERGGNTMEILTVVEVADLLKISRSQVYELTNEKTRTGEARKNPLPCVKIGTSVRFIRKEVESWFVKLSEKQIA